MKRREMLGWLGAGLVGLFVGRDRTAPVPVHVVPMTSELVYDGRGVRVLTILDHPPLHFNCRCVLVRRDAL